MLCWGNSTPRLLHDVLELERPVQDAHPPAHHINLPPLIRSPPLIRNPPLGGKNIVTINLDGGTITPLIRNPPSEANIVTINLDRGTINLDGGNEVTL